MFLFLTEPNIHFFIPHYCNTLITLKKIFKKIKMTCNFQHHVMYIASCFASPNGGDSQTGEFRVQRVKCSTISVWDCAIVNLGQQEHCLSFQTILLLTFLNIILYTATLLTLNVFAGLVGFTCKAWMWPFKQLRSSMDRTRHHQLHLTNYTYTKITTLKYINKNF